MEETARLAEHLGPHLKPAVKGRPPPWLRTTGSASETPHAWVDHPRNSVVLQVGGRQTPDVRRA